MKRTILFFILMMLLAGISAQVYSQQLPDQGFENWTHIIQGNVSYDEPAGSWWTSLNALAKLGCPVSLTKTSDAFAGLLAARLETVNWGTLVIPGLLVSGNFINTAPFILQGQPWTDTPIRFKGSYKYLPVNGDSAAIYAQLSRSNPITHQRDTIAEVRLLLNNTVSAFTSWDLPFSYYLPGVNPDSITLVFSSSAAGHDFQGQAGTVLILDEILLDYSNGMQESLGNTPALSVYPDPVSSILHLSSNLKSANEVEIRVFNAQGSTVYSSPCSGFPAEISVSSWEPAVYFLYLIKGNTIITKSQFIVSR